jgi:dTDP-glucose pyrophosphorylase
MKPTLLVLAAGMGSRYGGLKQIDPMGPGGETVLDYSVYDAIRAGFSRVVFVIREDFAEAFKAGIGARFSDRIEVDYAFQKLDDIIPGFNLPAHRTKPWGTGHAVRAARNLIHGAFAVINADDFYGHDAYVRAAKFLITPQQNRSKAHYAMVGYPLVNTLSEHGEVNRGICTYGPDQMLTAVEEYIHIQRDDNGSIHGDSLSGARNLLTGTTPVSMNFWIFTAGFFDFLEADFTRFITTSGHLEKSEYYIPSVVDTLIHSGNIDCEVLTTDSHWFGVTYPQDKLHVIVAIQQLIDRGDYPAELHRIANLV